MPKRPKARKPNITTPGPLDPWSMPQIQRFAQQQARATINPLLADIDRQQQTAAGNIQGFSTALAGVLAPLGQQVQGAYQNAAGMNDSFGSGFADGLKMLESQAPTAGGNATALGNLLGSLGGITNQAVGTEGAANSTVANAYALAAPNLGNQYLQQSRTQYDKQRAEVRGKVPETVQQIISSLLDREIQKDAQRANREALNLDKAKFEESKTQFDESLQLDRDKFRSDSRYRNATLRAEEDARTDRLKGDKKERNAAKNAAIDSATTDISTQIGAELEPQFADRVVGTQPKVAKIAQKWKTVQIDPERPRLGTKQVRDGYETYYYTDTGALTTDPGRAAQEPVYEKQPVSAPAYKDLRTRVIAMLKNSLRRYGIKDSRYQLLADSVLAPYFDVDYENLSTLGYGAADQGFDYSQTSLDAGYP